MEDYKLSEKLEAMKLTLMDCYFIGSIMQRRFDEFIKDAKDMESQIYNEGICSERPKE